MTLTVYTRTPDEHGANIVRQAPGPGDLHDVGTGSIIVTGEPDRERDFGRWAGAIGSAVLHGASVTRRSDA